MKSRKKIIKFAILGLFTAFLAVILYIGPNVKLPKGLIIYDVHTNSPRIIKEDGSIEFSDYVRIRNMTDHPYDLTGYFLSDSSKDYMKLPLDGLVIPAFDSVMIRLDPSWNFALKRDNSENVYLSDAKGKIIFM